MKLLHFLLILCLLPTISFSQESASEQQYKAAMQNAKTAFDAKMYSEALYFYREALKIKPDAKLPRYKIEDIRTMYIDDGIKEIAENKQVTQDEAKIEAETKADERIEAEIEQAQKELETLKIATVISIDEETVVDDENIDIADVEPTLETKQPEPEPIVVEPAKEEPKPIVEPVPQPVVEQPVAPVKEEPKPIEPEKKTVVTKQPIVKPAKPAPRQLTDEEKEARKEAEMQQLKIRYPEQKTVLEIDQPGKHITRVIMNIDNKVSVYLKVKHNWGATFYFQDEIGEDNLRSISEQTFNKMTNLATYGH